MAQNSKIEWTTHTWNPWWGCAKVSPACEHCYAETWAKRLGKAVWGAKAPRRFFGDAHWNEPLKWNADVQAMGERARVFCASMADVFEGRSDLDPWRKRLWTLIDHTPNLDWLLLSKRPENIVGMVPWTDQWPPNVWIGATVESQKYADIRLPHLLRHPAAVRFLSCEPLLEQVDLLPWMNRSGLYPIDWVIAGGESGHGSRPMHPAWVKSLRDQCVINKIPFHFKQWGQYAQYDPTKHPQKGLVKVQGIKTVNMVNVGKKIAGRLLGGRTYNGLPIVGGILGN